MLIAELMTNHKPEVAELFIPGNPTVGNSHWSLQTLVRYCDEFDRACEEEHFTHSMSLDVLWLDIAQQLLGNDALQMRVSV